MIRKASPDSLIEVLSSLGRPRMLVIGDLILDEYVWGGVERISPEAPIPVLRVSRRDYRLGGAGSVVANLDVLGAEVHMLSILGDDSSANTVVELLERSRCNTDLIGRVKGRPTTLKTRHLGYVQHADRAVQQMLRVDTEDVSPVPQKILDGLLGKLKSCIQDFDAILVSDYDKGLLGTGLLEAILDLGSCVPVLVDPARLDDYSRYRGAFLACPNRYETALSTNMSCDTVEACLAAGTKLAVDGGFDFVTVTMDRDGIYICPSEGESIHMATEARTVSDVTGAGDMVLSMLGLVIGAGRDVETAVRLANIAGGIEVRLLGASPIPRDDILSGEARRVHQRLFRPVAFRSPPSLESGAVLWGLSGRRPEQR
jgi:D-beta-D-heptose 7-phosphate kinase/D-beta-D-heptose 1-phosphate adenosyltransferase